MMIPRIYADFQNLDDDNRPRLTCEGTRHNLEIQGVSLREGMPLLLSTDDEDDDGRPNDLLVEGVATFDRDSECWVASVDWATLRYEKTILYVVKAVVCGDHALRLEFNDGTVKRVDVRPLLRGPIFEPLLEPSFFARMELDADFGVVQWPNGADLAPEALFALPDLDPAGSHRRAAPDATFAKPG